MTLSIDDHFGRLFAVVVPRKATYDELDFAYGTPRDMDSDNKRLKGGDDSPTNCYKSVKELLIIYGMGMSIRLQKPEDVKPLFQVVSSIIEITANGSYGLNKGKVNLETLDELKRFAYEMFEYNKYALSAHLLEEVSAMPLGFKPMGNSFSNTQPPPTLQDVTLKFTEHNLGTFGVSTELPKPVTPDKIKTKWN